MKQLVLGVVAFCSCLMVGLAGSALAAEPKPLPLTLDDAFVLLDEHALTLKNNGCELQLWTDFPAVQIYSRHPNGVAIEPEFYPDSPNHPEFPSTVLRPGEHFHRWAEYRFSPLSDTPEHP